MAQAALPLLVGSTLMQASAQETAGQNALASSKLIANQYATNANIANINAGQQDAIGIARAQENLRQNRYLQSKIIAMASAQGASPSTNKNVSDLIKRTAGEGEYAALDSIYEGFSRGDQLRNEAIGLYNKSLATRFEGKQAKEASNINTFSTILGGAAKGSAFYSKYNNPAPNDYSNNNFAGGPFE